MGEPKLKIDERDVGDVTVLELSGQILLDDGELEVWRRINVLGANGRVKILMDLSAVTYMDSAGVGMLASIVKKLRASHGDMKLLKLTTRGQRVFGTMKLHMLFEEFENE